MGEKRCLGCMERFPDELNMCPFCGYVVNTPVENAVHMEPGTLLADRYVVGKVLGYGGFGVTYVGWDGRLRQKVAIKEYFPTEFSTRMPGKTMLTLSNDQKKREQFESGLVKFVEEAKRLAKFQNTPGIVRIFDAFKENDTAYIIMEYLEGETLAEMLDRVGTIDEDQAVNMLMPVMKSLETVHKTGIIHRDIAPDNIFITKNGEVKLIDFGASRYATTSHSRSITVIIKPGYSPEEQYRSRGDQGPHTDVYALAATLYKMITGVVPPDALERRTSCETKRRDLIRLPHLLNKKVSKNIENALLNALNVRIEDRTPDIESFIEELKADPPVKRRYGNIKKIDLYQWPLWTKIAIPVAALLIIVGGVFAINSIVHIAPPAEAVIPDGMVIVPDIEGEKMSEATDTIKKGELNVTIAGNIESDYIEAGKIVLQDPLGGAYQDRWGNVNIWVSGGKIIENVIPLLTGSTEEEALGKLEKAGFKNIRKSGEEYNNDIDPGLVITQTPEYTGDKVPEDTEITYVISLGPKPFAMPSVVGKTAEEADSQLKATGLILKYAYKTGDDKDVGKIKEQSVSAGSMVKKGDTVTLTIITKKKIISVDDVYGLDEAEAKSKLESQGFKVKTGAEDFSDEPKGRVIKQNPAAGTSQTEGTTITLVISKGPKESTVVETSNQPQNNDSRQAEAKLTVSNVTNKKENVAITILNNQGLNVKTSYEFNDIEAGYVISQSPSAGSSLSKGETVQITVSKGTEKITVPKVIDMSRSDAQSTLEGKNLNVKVSEAYNSSYSEGRVFSQSPNYGSLVEKGTVINITVSLGQKPPEAVTVPNVVGKTESNAKSELASSSLKVRVSESNSDEVGIGNVISQSPPSGSSVDKNSVVYLTISKGRKPITVAFDANGGSVSRSSGTVYKGSTYDLPTPTRDHYTFTGWYTARSGGTRITSSTSVSNTSDHTLYAHWTKTGIIVTLDANGGSVSNSSIKVYYGSTYEDLRDPDRDYYTFAGWYTSKTGGTKITSTTTVSNSSNHTLYAHWTENPTSGWVLASEAPKDAYIKEQKWTYDLTTTKESNSSEMSGYTLYDTKWKWSNWGDWSGWQNDAVSGSDSREVDTRKVPIYKTQYHYTRYQEKDPSTGRTGHHGPWERNWGGAYCRYFNECYTDEELPYYGSQTVDGVYFEIWGTDISAWYNKETVQVKTGEYTQYRYRDRYKIYTYYFKKTESKESSTEVTAGGNITNVKKYVRYQER